MQRVIHFQRKGKLFLLKLIALVIMKLTVLVFEEEMDFMRVTKEKTVYQLSFMPRFFPVNCYLVEEEDSLTLIDTGVPFSTKGIMNTAKGIGKPIKKIVLTHGHDDHVGALDSLKEQLPEAEVYISMRDARLLTGDRSLDDDEPQTPIRGGVPKKVKTRPDAYLKEEDLVGSLLVIATPGHTPGSMSFLDIRNNILIAGDAFQTRGGMAVTGQLRLSFPFPAMATWNKEVALKSARKLVNYKPSILAVGHGDMIHEPITAIERAINDAREKLDQTSQEGRI